MNLLGTQHSIDRVDPLPTGFSGRTTRPLEPGLKSAHSSGTTGIPSRTSESRAIPYLLRSRTALVVADETPDVERLRAFLTRDTCAQPTFTSRISS